MSLNWAHYNFKRFKFNRLASLFKKKISYFKINNWFTNFYNLYYNFLEVGKNELADRAFTKSNSIFTSTSILVDFYVSIPAFVGIFTIAPILIFSNELFK